MESTKLPDTHNHCSLCSYINAMESRLHEAEALIGALIAFPRASNLISSLCKDPLADKIITRVNKSVFGPAGRPRSEEAANPRRRGRRRPDKERQRMSTSEVVYSRESGKTRLIFHCKSTLFTGTPICACRQSYLYESFICLARSPCTAIVS